MNYNEFLPKSEIVAHGGTRDGPNVYLQIGWNDGHLTIAKARYGRSTSWSEEYLTGICALVEGKPVGFAEDLSRDHLLERMTSAPDEHLAELCVDALHGAIDNYRYACKKRITEELAADAYCGSLLMRS